MTTSTVYRLLMGMLCLVLWPIVIAAYGDWRIGQAQERLKAAGFDPGYIDGVLGSRTRDALRRYQASKGLPITGQLDEATRQVLLAGDRARSGSAAQQESWLKAPPGGNYKKLSSIAQLPDYFPGLGTLYVDPATLPAGPFLAYNRQGNLVSSVYMIPLRDSQGWPGLQCISQRQGNGGPRRHLLQQWASRGARSSLPHSALVHRPCTSRSTAVSHDDGETISEAFPRGLCVQAWF